MSRVWRDSDGGRQLELLGLDAGHALAADYPARVVLAQVAGMDLSAFEAAYRGDGWGRPPYRPRVMAALLLYCSGDGRVSGQDVVDACHDDLGARLITGNQFPDRRTIDRFLSTHRQAWAQLLTQTLRMGHSRGLVDVSVVAGDGTSVQANAAMGNTVTAEQLEAQIAELDARLDTAVASWQVLVGGDQVAQLRLLSTVDAHDAVDAVDGEVMFTGPDQAADKAWAKVRALSNKRDARREALARLRNRPSVESADWLERVERDQRRVQTCTQRLENTRAQVQAANERRAIDESTGAMTRGRRPVPVDKHAQVVRATAALARAKARAQATIDNHKTVGKINTTDPTSRLMLAKHGGYDQLHNVQALACQNQFIIAITTHDNPNDKQAMIDLLRQSRTNLDLAAITDHIRVALFDNGYASEANFTADLPVDTLLVAVEKEGRQTGRLKDSTTTAANAWTDMAQRLADPTNTALYKRRAAIIEPLFAQLFTRFGRRIHVRGEDVQTQLHLWATAHNLLKIHRHDQRNTPPG